MSRINCGKILAELTDEQRRELDRGNAAKVRASLGLPPISEGGPIGSRVSAGNGRDVRLCIADETATSAAFSVTGGGSRI